MITLISRKLAMNLKNMVPHHPASVEVLRFALEAIINGILIVFLSLFASVFLGNTSDVLLILLAFALLRQLSGGMHLKSGVACVIVSTTIVVGVSMFNLEPTMIKLINIINILLFLLFAPSNIEKQTRIPKKYYPLLKIISSVLVASNLLIGSSILAITFFIQGISLIHLFRKGGERS